jgi:tight adherence protein C
MGFYPLALGLMVAVMIISLGLFCQQKSSRMRLRLQVQKKPEIMRMEVEEHYLPASVVGRVEESLGLKKDGPKFKKLKRLLVQAGFSSDRAVSIFLGLKLGLTVALPVLALPFLPALHLPGGLAAAALYALVLLGYFLPTLIVGHLVQVRQKKIKEGLPDSLDLMVVCVEAGQGLNAAIKRVADELVAGNPTLARELLMVNLEINAGIEREHALRNLAERTGVEEVASLCNILIQSDRLGTSIAQTLKIQSETLRTTRRLKLEELAARTPVKLVFPLILFIFPAIMVVILGPAAIKISENLLR